MGEIEIAELQVKVQCVPTFIPKYASVSASGADLHADLENAVEIAPGERIVVPTGVRIEIPPGYEGQVRPRSGLARNHGIGIVNAPGTIDADYRGEIQVLLVNYAKVGYTIQPKDRVAQLVIAPVIRAKFVPVTTLLPTERGSGGFGVTGK